jgi:hypothetical protein
MFKERGKHLLQSILFLFSICLVSCGHDATSELISRNYENIASIFTSNDIVCFLFHFDPGCVGESSYDLYTYNNKTKYCETLRIRGFGDSMPMVDSIVKGSVFVHYNFVSDNKLYSDTLEFGDVFLGDLNTKEFGYRFFNQNNNCGNQLLQTLSFDSIEINMPFVLLYSKKQIISKVLLSILQFPYRSNTIEYLTMNGCTEQYTILEPQKNMSIDVIKKKVLNKVFDNNYIVVH